MLSSLERPGHTSIRIPTQGFKHVLTSAVLSQESKERQALWVVPQSMADIEDEVVRTVQSSIMTDRGVDVRRDLQVLTLCHLLAYADSHTDLYSSDSGSIGSQRTLRMQAVERYCQGGPYMG